MEEMTRSGGLALACLVIGLSVIAVMVGPLSKADPPSDSDLIQPFPVITPTPTNWAPQFPFPYDQTRNSVTAADITAQREMCQWFNAQYNTLIDQINRVQFNRIQQNGPGVRVGSGTDWDYSVDGVQQQVDIVTANIQRSVDFLAPRAQALTQSTDFAGDNYFPLYQGESFYHLWQYLAAVNDGIQAHQPDWFTGPSIQRTLHWGSEINRSHVCR